MTFLLFVLALIIAYSVFRAYKNTKDVIVNKVALHSPNQNPLNLNILQLSDLHLENISISPEELYQRLKHESVDLIALTGDFLDRKRSIPKLIPYLKVLNELNPAYGIYAVFGNHDYVLSKANLQELKQTLLEYNCKVLQNENDYINVNGKHVNIIGIDNFSTKHSDLVSSYEGVKSGFNLVLTHDPNVVLYMKDYHFDYLLSGHFHGGQICYPKAYHLVKMGKLARMNVIKGLHTLDGKPFYISEGLGQTGVNIRVGSRPEITIHQVSAPAVSHSVQSAI
jgi:predicted MPP superfamily phosphohydrolase